MRGDDEQQSGMFSYVSAEQRAPQDHPLRAMRRMTDTALRGLSRRFDAMYAKRGRPSIAPEKLLRALLLQMLYSIRSERLLMEQLDYNLLFRWFVGLNMDDRVWDASTFSQNRERLLRSDVAGAFFDQVRRQAEEAGLMSDEHFSVDGTLIEAWAGQKSLRRVDGDDGPRPGGRNPEVNFHGEKRSNDTHISTTDPEAMLARKTRGERDEAGLPRPSVDGKPQRAGGAGAADARLRQRGNARRAADAGFAAGIARGDLRGGQGLRQPPVRVGVPQRAGQGACGAQASRQRHPGGEGETGGLPDQPEKAEAGRGGVRVDEDGRVAAQGAIPGTGAGGVGLHLRRRRLQSGPHAQAAGAARLISERGAKSRALAASGRPSAPPKLLEIGARRQLGRRHLPRRADFQQPARFSSSLASSVASP